MTSSTRRALTFLLLAIVTLSSLIDLLGGTVSGVDETCSPFVLVEVAEEGEAEESSDEVVLVAVDPLVTELTPRYAVHIAEECEFDRARKRKSHFWRGPPTV